MKIISFCSNPASWSGAFVEATIASALQKAGHEVLFITPGKEFKKKSNIIQENILRKEFGLPGYTISEVLTDADRKEIAEFMANLKKENFDKRIVDGIAVGKVALYEFLVGHKKMSADIADSEWLECREYIENTIIALCACRRILEKEKPDAVLMYNNLYSTNGVWKKYAEQKNVPVYFIHHGHNISERDDIAIIAKGTMFDYITVLKNIWPEFKNIPIPADKLRLVTNHFLSLLEAKSSLVFSIPKSKDCVDTRKIFGIAPNRKILTATMSSYDEMFGADYIGARHISQELFHFQADWIKALIEYVEPRPDLFLIIRVHPREFPGKDDKVKSVHATMLEKHFKNLPSNVKINWPSDNVSMYDLAQDTDVFLNGWSSVGTEMSLFGIGVVVYSPEALFYPANLNYVGISKTDYFNAIEQALKDGWQFDRIKYTYRWLSLFFSQTVIRLRKKKENDDMKTISSKTPLSVRSMPLYAYNLLPLPIKHLVKNILVKTFGVEEGQELRGACKDQLKQEIDVGPIEKMLLQNDVTLVSKEKVLAESVSPEEEHRLLGLELKRLYDALYGVDTHEPKAGSLQYYLKQSIMHTE